jgi:hypothetical protein
MRLPPNVVTQIQYVLNDAGDADARSTLSRTALPFHHVWLGVTEDDLACKETDGGDLNSLADLKLGAPLSDGSVWQACDNSSCNYVLKAHFFYQPADREAAQTELKALQELQGTGLVPQLVRWRRCQDRMLLLMERWDMDAESLGRRQYQRLIAPLRRGCGGNGASTIGGGGGGGGGRGVSNRPMLLFTESQIRQLFALAQSLGERGYAHAHLHPANIMYRVSDDQFVVVGLGLGGDSKKRMQCSPPPRGPLGTTAAQRNVWQLLVALGADYPAILIALEEESTRQVRQVSLLIGLGPQYADLLPRSDIPAISMACQEADRELLHTRRQEQIVRTLLLRKIEPFWL